MMNQLISMALVLVLAACGGPNAAPGPAQDPEAETGAVSTGWNAEALEDLIALAADANSDTLLVMRSGEIIVEEYFDTDSEYRRDIASAQKSIVSLLVGIAEGQGLLDIDDPVIDHLGTGWAHGAATEAEITVRHLLTMASGLNSDFETVAAPGTLWEYNNNAYHKLRLVLEAVAGTGIQELSDGWLFDPLDIEGQWSPRRGLVGARDSYGERLMGLSMRASDLAAIGMLVLADGLWDGTQIVPADFVADALSPSQELNPAYGYLWWLNGSDHHILPIKNAGTGPLAPDGPPDAAGALGAADQKLWLSPELDLIIVRQGGSALGWRASLSAFDNTLWRAVMDAYPEG